MDWTAKKGVDNRTVQIALIKLPASVPVTDSRYGGAVVFNPGETCYSTAEPIT
jgi:hypothetical protein